MISKTKQTGKAQTTLNPSSIELADSIRDKSSDVSFDKLGRTLFGSYIRVFRDPERTLADNSGCDGANTGCQNSGCDGSNSGC